jgi:hypothetical protein
MLPDRLTRPGSTRSGCARSGGINKRRVRADDDGLPLRAVPVNDREKHFVPPVRAVDIARPERGKWPRSPTVRQKEPLMATR